MPTWNSIDEIIQEFGTNTESDDLTNTLILLKKELHAIHPDKTGGKFEDKKIKIRYYRIQEAIGFVEKLIRGSNALVPINQLPAIIDSLSKALSKRNEPTIEVASSSFVSDFHRAVKRRYFLPKVTSGVLAGICVFLFTFAGQFEKHPVLQRLFSESFKVEYFGILTLVLALYAGVGFIFIWYKEGNSDAKAEYLVSDEGLHKIFSGLCASTTPLVDGKIVFSARQLADLIKEGAPGFRGVSIWDSSLAEKIASIHISKLKERNVIKEEKTPDLDQWYEVAGEVAERYRDRDSSTV